MPIRCFYLDDEPAQTVAPLWQLLEQAANHQIQFDYQQPLKDFGEQVAIIKKAQPDILILDLRLDENRNGHGEIADYRGFALAQELRTRMTERKLPSVPIVLWSMVSKLKQSYNKDDSAHRLFDRVYVKDQEIISQPHPVALELQSLVKGYQLITEERNKATVRFHQMLGLTGKESDYLHPGISEPFATRDKYPVHEYARYILRELIEIQGALINEAVLAARLGVDIKASSDWEKCKKRLAETCAYQGAFHEAWPRWWAFPVEEWWQNRPNRPGTLRSLTAKERVKFLRSTTHLTHLHPAAPVEEGYSERYWTICQGFEQPLDEIDGIMLSFPNQKIWQEPLYVSIKAALERVGKETGWRMDPLEYERFNDLKKRRRDNGK